MLEIIGQPLLEAAAQTFVGAIAGYSFDKMKNRIYGDNSFDGPFDLWQRGIHCQNITYEDTIAFDGFSLHSTFSKRSI